MARSAALRRIAGNVQKFAFLLTLRAFLRRCSRCDEIPTISTFPESQTTLRTDIPCKLAVTGVATVGTYPFLLLVFHFLTSYFFKFIRINNQYGGG